MDLQIQIQLLQTFFTPAPYYLYNDANKEGNLAYAGIGLGLINTQRIFWIANFGTGLYIYYDLSHVSNFLFTVILLYLYYHSISKTIYLLRLCTK